MYTTRLLTDTCGAATSGSKTACVGTRRAGVRPISPSQQSASTCGRWLRA